MSPYLTHTLPQKTLNFVKSRAFSRLVTLCGLAICLSHSGVSDQPLKRPASDMSALAKHLDAYPAKSAALIAKAALPIDAFTAVASVVEGLNHRVYIDSGGLNLGFGYCLTQRYKNMGASTVTKELQQIGLSPNQIHAVIAARNHKVAPDITLTQGQMLNLSYLLKDHYEQQAINAVGDRAYFKLPNHRKAALVYLAYNTSDIRQFKNLIQTIQKSPQKVAKSQLTPRWRSKEGKWNTNHRLGSWLWALWQSPSEFETALLTPHHFDRVARLESKQTVKPGSKIKPPAKDTKALKAPTVQVALVSPQRMTPK